VARKPREEFPDAIVHVFARGVRKLAIYVDDVDRECYVALLGQVVERQGWRLLAYCLMRNHVHLLVQTPEPNLGAGMCRLHGMHAQAFNKRHGHTGHVFQGRYAGVVVRTDAQLLAVARYIALNPVEARLCEEASEWAWSSHAAVAGGVAPPLWLDVASLLGYFGADGGDPRERYLDFVRSPAPNGSGAAPDLPRGAPRPRPPRAPRQTQRRP
jgi:REP element-mobilizing transposase RayT